MDLDRLCLDLQRDLQADPKGPRVAELLAAYAAGASDDWRRFALFDERSYARNLVHASERFELILLCWGADQVSPIHNHAGQRCWMACIDGRIAETHYRLPESGTGAPIAGATRTFDPGQVAFITDDIALHRIAPTGGHPGVSLHLYAEPIRECNLYCERTGRIEHKVMAYHSVRGVLQPQA